MVSFALKPLLCIHMGYWLSEIKWTSTMISINRLPDQFTDCLNKFNMVITEDLREELQANHD